MKISRFWIYLILWLFVMWLWVWQWAKKFIKLPILWTTTKSVTKPIVQAPIKTTETITTDTSEDPTTDPVTDSNITKKDSSTVDPKVWIPDKKTDTVKDIVKSKYSYILIAWLSASQNLQNTLVSLYNTELKTITYLPYDYYIEEYMWQKDVSIWSLTIDQIRDYLTISWVTISDQVLVDQDTIFDLFTSTMSWDEYILSYVDDSWKKIDVPVKTKAHLYNLISKDNLSQYKNLEQLHNTILNLLVKSNVTIWKILVNTKDINFDDKTLYKEWDFSSVTSKWFEKQQLNWKFFSMDVDHKFLKSLLTWDFTEYTKYRDDEIKTKKEEDDKKLKEVEKLAEVKTETLQEKLLRLKSEKESSIIPMVEKNVVEVKTESLAEKLKRLRGNQTTN